MADEMERARAARILLSERDSISPFSPADRREAEVAAFMAIFHPDRQLPAGERYTDNGKGTANGH